jgi:hypothetical protein
VILIIAALSATAGEIRPVRVGDTVEAFARSLGDPGLAGPIRQLNGLGPGEQAKVGQLLTLPPPDVPHADQLTFLLSATGGVTVDGAPATTYTPIPLGSTICTGNAGFATMRLATQCTDTGTESDDLSLTNSTCLQVESAFATVWGRSALVHLDSGSVVISENSVASGNITVVTDSGWTTGSEGGFRVNVEEAAMRTEALYARVAVQGMGVEVALDAAQGSRVNEGKVPEPPVDLLVAKELYNPADGMPMYRPEFTWEGDPRAFGYRIEIASDAAFEDLVYLTDVPDPVHRPELLMLPGDDRGLWWRIAPFDPFRFVGVPSSPRVLAIPQSSVQ